MNATRLRELRESPEYAELLDLVLRDKLEAKRVLPIERVVVILGVSDPTVRRLINTNKLGHCRPAGGRLGVTQEQLIAYIDSQSYNAAS